MKCDSPFFQKIDFDIMSKPIFWKKCDKYFKLLSAKIFSKSAKG